MAQTRIRMINSVHGRFKNGKHYDLVAGEEYWVDEAKADEWILKGYAAGELSKDYTDDEIGGIRSNVQVVGVTSNDVIEVDPKGLANG